MFVHPQFDPVALSLGPIAIHWYGLMYLFGFLAFFVLAKKRLPLFQKITMKDIDNIMSLSVLGVILGGRLGYVVFYKPAYFLSNPLEVFYIWQGGMSFHGGFIGVLLICLLYARKKGWRFLYLMDFIAPTIPIGLAFGRLGNFINGELWGRPTSGPWGMVFPQAGDNIARHPSQLYQVGLEGLLLMIVLWCFARRPRPIGQVSALFLIGYGACRFVVEFARQPDSFLGVLSLGLTMGQWLSLPMIMAGGILWFWVKKVHAVTSR